METEKKYEFTADELSALIKKAVSEALAENTYTVEFALDQKDDEITKGLKEWVDYVPLSDDRITVEGLKFIPKEGEYVELYDLITLPEVKACTHHGEILPTLTEYTLSLRRFKVSGVMHAEITSYDGLKEIPGVIIYLETVKVTPSDGFGVALYEKRRGRVMDWEIFEEDIPYLDEIEEARNFFLLN